MYFLITHIITLLAYVEKTKFSIIFLMMIQYFNYFVLDHEKNDKVS